MNRHGIWIWENGAPQKDEYADFTDKITLAEEGAPVSLRISADSNYAVYVNGALAAFGQYADFPYCKVVNTHDITAYCKKGENDLLITVWYYGIECSTYALGQAGLFFEVSVDGTVAAVSGEHTLCRANPYYVPHRGKCITPTDIGLSYFYNAAGKALPYHGAVATGYAPELHERPILPLVLDELRPGVVIGGDGLTHFLLDIGREDCGFLELALESETEQTIIIAYGEHVEDGHVSRILGARDFSVEYGTVIGENHFLNAFRRLGCRYLEVFAENPIKLRLAGIRPTSYPLTEIPFDAGTPLRRQIYEVAKRTLRLCMHEHYEDCPWREQSLFGGDGRNEMMAAYYLFGETKFSRASLWLLAQDTREDKFMPICAPAIFPTTIPSFGLHWYQALREYVEHSGDAGFAKEMWGRACDQLDAFLKYYNEEEAILYCPWEKQYWNFYEWAGALLRGAGVAAQQLGKRTDLILNCLFIRALDAMAYLAEKTGLTYEPVKMADTLRASVRKYFRREDGLYDTFTSAYHELDPVPHISELGNALAILTGVADETDAAAICRMLSNTETEFTIRKVDLGSLHDYVTDVLPDITGILPVVSVSLGMCSFVYDALLMTDTEKYREFVLNDVDTRCKYMLDRGATTFWETLEGQEGFAKAGSLCHGWSALPACYYRKLL